MCDTTREYRDTLTQKVLDILVDAGYTIEDEGTYFYQGGTSLGGNGQSTYGVWWFSSSYLLTTLQDVPVQCQRCRRRWNSLETE